MQNRFLEIKAFSYVLGFCLLFAGAIADLPIPCFTGLAIILLVAVLNARRARVVRRQLEAAD